MHHPSARLNVANRKRAKLRAAKSVKEQGGENRPVAKPLQCRRRRRVKDCLRLIIAQGRGFSLIRSGIRPLHAIDGIERHSITLAEVIEKRRDRGELAPHSCRFQRPCLKLLAPGNQMRSLHHAELFRLPYAGEQHEILHVSLIRAPRIRVFDIREPLHFRRHICQLRKLGIREPP